jgi:hypothetical protein
MSNIKLFESKKIRSQWDEENEKWYFSIKEKKLFNRNYK